MFILIFEVSLTYVDENVVCYSNLLLRLPACARDYFLHVGW